MSYERDAKFSFPRFFFSFPADFEALEEKSMLICMKIIQSLTS